MERVDVLIVNALRMELDAVESALVELGVALERNDCPDGVPYLSGTLPTPKGPRRIALARPTRMGAVPVATAASSLVTLLRPNCLAMSGVCAGNPSDVALGDIIVAELAYAYDEGKRTSQGFEGDHRQVPLLDRWLRLAQELPLDGLSTYGAPDDADRRDWLLEQLAAGVDPSRHPARSRYLGGAFWATHVRALEGAGMIVREGARFVLTEAGRDATVIRRAYDLAPPRQLPFAVHVGPIASGNAVVKDGVTWDSLKAQGVRTVLGLEMEAAAMAQVAHRLEVPRWIVVKGVMDYADPNKDDRFKPFAAAASAQVLLRFLQSALLPDIVSVASSSVGNATNVIGNISGSNISVHQAVTSRKP